MPDSFEDDPDPVTPTVVAVVVTSEPGPWFEEALGALTNQDYPHLSILVVDTGATDVTPRVAEAAPNAYVRRVEGITGYSAAANEVLGVVEGASHYVFCHDDVAPDPDAIRLLLEEAFRSNAAVVGPKFVQWDDAGRLLQVGLSADKGGITTSQVERGELDQEQHDAVRDVFAIPGGLTLVRADLFATLGGYDPQMPLVGEDLDLCWRAQIAGGRVLVAPAARARHVEAMSRGLRPGQTGGKAGVRPLEARHRLRAVLKNYSRFHLLRVLPQVALLSLAEVIYTFLVGRRGAARAIVNAWTANLRGLGELRAARRQVRSYRVWPDSEVRRLQVRGNARLTKFLRGQLGRSDRARLIGDRDWSGSWRSIRMPIAVWAGLALVLVLGARSLISGSIPAVGEFAPIPGPGTLLRLFVSEWRTSGLGATAPAPPAFGILGLAGMALLGGMGLLQKLLILGTVPLGLVGVYRLVRPFGSTAARLVTLIVYASIPVAYNALARGRLDALIAYAVLPWALGSLFRATGAEPWVVAAEPAGSGGTIESGARRRAVVRLALLLAGAAAFAPSVLIAVLVAALGLALGGVLAGGGGGRAVVVGVAATGIALVLLAPWSLDLVIPGSGVERITAVAPAPSQALDLGGVLRFHTGRLGGGPVGFAFVIAAALPLVVGHGWRLAWATRCWGIALAGFALAWVGGRGWLPFPSPTPEIALAPSAVALAVAAGLGLIAFRSDVPAYRFGWRQFASSAAAVAVSVATVPVLGAATGGRFYAPERDFRSQLSWMPERRVDGAFRVLWVGVPSALPMDGWAVEDGLAYGLSDDGVPDVTALWPASDSGATGLVADALRLARDQRTTRLGRELSPMAVRYIIVVDRAAPSADARRLGNVSPRMLEALAEQLDLKRVSDDRGQLVYENAAWGPGRSRLRPDRDDPETVKAVDLAGAAPALRERRNALKFTGTAESDDTVWFSQAASDRWRLTVDGEAASRETAIGWANAFTVDGGGRATLSYKSSVVRPLIVAVELLLVLVAARYAINRRSLRSRRRSAA